MNQKMLVVSAHVGDFVWRSAGTIAKYTKEGACVHVVVLTYGARGESGAYWKGPNATLNGCKAARHAEAEAAAKVLGVEKIEFWDYEDFPLQVTNELLERLALKIRCFRPDFILTHDKGSDDVNLDHTYASQAVTKAYAIASAYGAYCEGAKVAKRQTPIFGFEPATPEKCDFIPDIYIDITDTYATKKAAMECLKTQSGSMATYEEKAILRGNHCKVRGGRDDCKYAEAFTRFIPVYAYDAFVW